MDPSEVKQMMEHLMARMNENQARRDAKLDADNKDLNVQIGGLASKMDADRMADKEVMMATIRRGQEEMIKAITGASRESTEACEEKVKALPETTEAYPETTEACPEVTPACLRGEKESAPEKPESVAEPKEVPERATEQETGQAAEDQTGELRLAVRCHRQRRKRAQEHGGPRQKFAAFRGRVTRRPVPALIKGHVRKGPRRNRRRDIRGPGKASGSRMEDGDLKQHRIKDNVVQGAHKERTRPVFENGIRNQDPKKKHSEDKREESV
jgi:hypothetical protein